MIVVLIASRYQKLLEWICGIEHDEIKSIQVIKQNGPKIFLYVETTLQQDDVHHLLKEEIKKQGGVMYVYELYGIFNGKIDYNAYMSEETKQSMKYYQTVHKDMTDQEIEDFKKRS